jgi:uncharacterized protein with gpF-like domain
MATVSKIKKGRKTNYAIGIDRQYRSAIQKLITQLETDMKQRLKAFFTPFSAQDAIDNVSRLSSIFSDLSKTYKDVFKSAAQKETDRFVADLKKNSAKRNKSVLEEVTGVTSVDVDYEDPDMRDAIRAIVAESLQVLETIPTKLIEKTQKMVMGRVATQGLVGVYSGIEETLTRFGKQTKSQAGMSQTDLVNKASVAITRQQYLQDGIEKFEWNHSSASLHPRPLHVQYDGQIFSLTDLPVIDKDTGERGIPGQLPNCRCFMTPVLGDE